VVLADCKVPSYYLAGRTEEKRDKSREDSADRDTNLAHTERKSEAAPHGSPWTLQTEFVNIFCSQGITHCDSAFLVSC
jgi:hypothetical protein